MAGTLQYCCITRKLTSQWKKCPFVLSSNMAAITSLETSFYDILWWPKIIQYRNFYSSLFFFCLDILFFICKAFLFFETVSFFVQSSTVGSEEYCGSWSRASRLFRILAAMTATLLNTTAMEHVRTAAEIKLYFDFLNMSSRNCVYKHNR